ncbi:hypothetical protein C8J30_101159 [Rhodobacter viridis]|uniref:Oxidoreductase molybdopterin-binding domain-containing protein n=1 Tax=Rhodobacter viridis TaxID=1054202 RepID=A0A318U2R8_9RHOB|nr:oxidoreductase [Rhodobacter viridis]PYF12778.1 hypothetical protein C8J30_101159 [Rhodobacter viridis]
MRSTTKTAMAAVILSLSLLAAAGFTLHAQGALAESPAPVAAAPLDAPTGTVMLTVTGKIGVTNAEGAAKFDATMLAALPRTNFETSTIWTEGVQAFSGIELRALLDRLGVTDGTLKITAINDYSVQIPVSDIAAGGALLADHRDGKLMTVRDKGPLWLVYPYDSASEFRNEVVYSRSVWQVDRIEVQP